MCCGHCGTAKQEAKWAQEEDNRYNKERNAIRAGIIRLMLRHNYATPSSIKSVLNEMGDSISNGGIAAVKAWDSRRRNTLRHLLRQSYRR